MKKAYPFKKAVLNDRDGDVSKRWYIEYSAWDVQAKALRRKYDTTINAIPTLDERYISARVIISQINDLLARGYHIDAEKSKALAEGVFPKVADAYERALDVKRNELSKESINSYSSTITVFKEWLQNTRYKGLNINQLTVKHCYEFVDELSGRGISPRTINSRYIDYLKSFHNTYMTRNKELKKNPWLEVVKKKEVGSTRNVAFNEVEVDQLKRLISAVDSELWVFIQFIYYCFLRPNEIRQLQVYNVQINRGLIFIDAIKAKNKKDAYISIPPKFLTVLKKMVQGKKSMEYLFPGTQQGKPVSKNVMAERFKKYMERVELGVGHTFYSWKHTGVIMAYNAGIDIKTLQAHLRHASLEETDTYLRSLGLIQSNDIITKFPDL